MTPFVFSILYVWCKNEPEGQVSLWGFPVEKENLPWALLLMSVLTGGSPFDDLIGIAVGHTYIFLKMTLPNSHGYDLLKTPSFLQRIVMRLVAWG
jgi:Derlin-2/3